MQNPTTTTSLQQLERRSALALYFFHIDYGDYLPDMEGTELPSPAAARAGAVALLGRLLSDEGDSFWQKPNIRVTVTDEWGVSLLSVETRGIEMPTADRKYPAPR